MTSKEQKIHSAFEIVRNMFQIIYIDFHVENCEKLNSTMNTTSTDHIGIILWTSVKTTDTKIYHCHHHHPIQFVRQALKGHEDNATLLRDSSNPANPTTSFPTFITLCLYISLYVKCIILYMYVLLLLVYIDRSTAFSFLQLEKE